MAYRAKRSMVKADFRGSDMKTSEGPAVAVMCETRDLGIKWSQWHTLMFEGQVQVDMR